MQHVPSASLPPRQSQQRIPAHPPSEWLVEDTKLPGNLYHRLAAPPEKNPKPLHYGRFVEVRGEAPDYLLLLGPDLEAVFAGIESEYW